MSSCSDRSTCSTCAVVIVADVDDYWLHGTTRYYLHMIFAFSENGATQVLLHRRQPELRVLWHAGLVEIVAHVIVADVDVLAARPYSLFAVVAYRSRQVDFAAQNNSGKECGDGYRLLHLAACGLLLWFSQISIGRTLTRVVDTVPPGSAGREGIRDHVRAKGIQARMLYNGSGRATVAEILPSLTHLRSILSPARHWSDC